MNKSELYQKTVDILVQAYLTDMLKHRLCFACAVGNLVRVNNSIPCDYEAIPYYWDSWGDYWSVMTGENMENETGLKQIAATGYTPKELHRIEKAFEECKKSNSEDEYMFNGLMAVIDILDQIHGNTDTEVTTTQKNRFTKLVTA